MSRQLRAFQPDVIHITGPSELGIFGAYFAWKHGVKLAASWHTNLHEYAARRLAWLSRLLPLETAARLESGVEAGALAAIVALLQAGEGAVRAQRRAMRDAGTAHRQALPPDAARRGYGAVRPERRTRGDDGALVLGYVGRLSIEKNVALLVRIERELEAMGVRGCGFLIVGHGDEEEMLRRELHAGRLRRGAARRIAGRGLREYGPAGVSVAHGHVRQCGAGGAGERGAGGGDSGWRAEVYCARRRDGVRGAGRGVCGGDCGAGAGPDAAGLAGQNAGGGSGARAGVLVGCGV